MKSRHVFAPPLVKFNEIIPVPVPFSMREKSLIKIHKIINHSSVKLTCTSVCHIYIFAIRCSGKSLKGHILLKSSDVITATKDKK